MITETMLERQPQRVISDLQSAGLEAVLSEIGGLVAARRAGELLTEIGLDLATAEKDLQAAQERVTSAEEALQTARRAHLKSRNDYAEQQLQAEQAVAHGGDPAALRTIISDRLQEESQAARDLDAKGSEQHTARSAVARATQRIERLQALQTALEKILHPAAPTLEAVLAYVGA